MAKMNDFVIECAEELNKRTKKNDLEFCINYVSTHQNLAFWKNWLKKRRGA